MGLSHDIISEFVKITNDNKEKPKEGIVYATIVQASNGKYVKIDGSDLLTPTDTTTDIEDGERVTVMIKDHTATVTGNVSSPSASTNRVDKVVETVSEEIGAFELVVADKVSTNELEAYKVTVDTLIAGKAEIEDLEATNAEIENLKVKDAEIENLVADKATIEDLEAVNATIENLKVKDAEIENAVIGNLEATKAEIGILEADFAQIKTLVSGNLTSDNILSFNITADKVTMEDAFIKDAMIDTVSAAKINAGKINTNSVTIGSEDGGMLIAGATQQFTDKNGNVRIQIGRDTSGDFTFVLYGEDGTGQIINQNGITASAISDGIIVNDMISDDASISGGKLDISSVVTEINNDNTTTIKSNKIYLNEQNQSLEVAFNSLKTQVDTIQDVTIDGGLTAIVEQVQSNTSKIEVNASSINTLISEDTVIKKQVTDLENNVVESTNTLTSKYASLNQSLDGFKTTVANTYATKSSVNDVKNNLSTNYSTTSAMNSAINQKVDEITASVSSTYATKNEVQSIDDNIKSNYSTTEQMESAISVAKDEINLGISKVYETKEEVTNKVTTAIGNIQVGGKNLIKNSKKILLNASDNGNINCSVVENDYVKITPKNNGNVYNTDVQTYETRLSGVTYTLSFDILTPTQIGFYWYPSENYSKSNYIPASESWQRVSFTYTQTGADTTATTLFGLQGLTAGYTYKYKHLKLEKGNKATDWTPAPEDIDSEISSAKSNAISESKNYTDSQIKISKDAIELGISEKYETKENVTTKITNAVDSIQVGSRNYIVTNRVSSYTPYNSFTEKRVGYLKSTRNTSDTSGYFTLSINNYTPEKGVYTISGKLKVNGAIPTSKYFTGLANTYGSGLVRNEYDATTGKFIITQTYSGSSGAGGWLFHTITTSKNSAGDVVEFFDLQFEKGNKATDFHPSPEDVDTSITTAETNAVTTSKNYADSQINVAKNAITQSVSSTYATKTDVTSSINGVNSSISNLQNRMNSAEQKITDSAIVSTVTNSSSWKTQTNNLNSALNKLSINEQTKMNGLELLPQGYLTNDSKGYGVDYNHTLWRNNRIEVTGREWISTDLIKFDRTKPLYWYINTTNSSNNMFHFGVERFDKNKSTIEGQQNNATYYFLSGSVNGEREGYWQETSTSTAYIRLRILCDWNNTGTATTIIKSIKWKQLGASVTNDLAVRMSSAESKITDSSITNTVKQNFYTKTETDGKVTTVQNNMQSSITQLSNQIATKVDVNGVLSTIQQNPNSIQIGFNKISNALTIDSTGMIAKAQNGNKYYQLGYDGITMYNPVNGTHEWGRISAINSKFTVASNGNSTGLSLGHFVSGSYAEDILCSSAGVVHIQRQMNHNGILYNNYGHIIVRQSGQGGWEITGRSDSQAIKPGGANQGAIGSSTQYINQSWIANRYNPSSLKLKHLSHYIDDLECLKLVNDVKPARYFYKEYNENGDDVTTFTSRTSQLGLIYEDVRACSGRDLITNEEDAAINLYGMVSVLWGAVRNLNNRLNDVEYENVTLKNELEEVKNMLNKS